MQKILRLTINGTGAFADVVIVAAEEIEEEGDGEGIPTDTVEFVPPTVDPVQVIHRSKWRNY